MTAGRHRGTPPPALTVSELSRYRRHLSLPEVGVAGQERLKASSIAIVGVGGL
ncbi:MAG: HesA/MoeB/ThiF family protein, partial [Acidobacteriota bacterium]|nr:HesA/MoeB/ThiF family protein [Acidobacteriota bacterium]